MKAFIQFTLMVLTVGAGALLASCGHRERVVVVQPQTPAPAAQPQTVVVERDTQRPAPSSMIVVHEAPPPPREESAPPPPPASNQTWAPGHWEYQNNNYVWVSGQWIVRPQASNEYVPPHWENRPEGWVYTQGYWK